MKKVLMIFTFAPASVVFGTFHLHLQLNDDDYDGDDHDHDDDVALHDDVDDDLRTQHEVGRSRDWESIADIHRMAQSCRPFSLFLRLFSRISDKFVGSISHFRCSSTDSPNA